MPKRKADTPDRPFGSSDLNIEAGAETALPKHKGKAVDAPKEPVDRLLAEAWRFFKDYDLNENGKRVIGEHVQAQRRATIALALGYSTRQFEAWLENGGAAPASQRARIDIVSLYQHLSDISDPYIALSSAIRKTLDTDTKISIGLKNYEGVYSTVRFNKDDSTIIGEMSIEKDRGTGTTLMSRHSYMEILNKQAVSFLYYGPIVDMHSRFYVMSARIEDPDPTISMIIFRKVHNPLKQVTFGITLLEDAKGYSPISSMIALVPKSFDLSKHAVLDEITSNLQGKLGQGDFINGFRHINN